MSRDRVVAGLDALARAAEAAKALAPQVTAVAARYAAVLRGGGTLFFCGNGGSAADAQHLATEYVVRYSAARRPFAAVALTTDTSVLTAAGNDLGFDRIFARQVEAHCGPGDLLVLHSTSGRSANLLAAARTARERGVPTVAFLGQGGGPLADLVDEAVRVPSAETSHIQVLQLSLEHLIVELVEAELAAGA
ncbi:MAG TPA: SIS domain-containing protein [Gemmatimonadales bacterium]|nr:SIS domain-containing protein [Gemmatimonadales bacterium]